MPLPLAALCIHQCHFIMVSLVSSDTGLSWLCSINYSTQQSLFLNHIWLWCKHYASAVCRTASNISESTVVLYCFCFFLKTNSVMLKGKTRSSIMRSRSAYLCSCTTKIPQQMCFYFYIPSQVLVNHGSWRFYFVLFQYALFASLCFRYSFFLYSSILQCPPSCCLYSVNEEGLNSLCNYIATLILHSHDKCLAFAFRIENI